MIENIKKISWKTWIVISLAVVLSGLILFLSLHQGKDSDRAEAPTATLEVPTATFDISEVSPQVIGQRPYPGEELLIDEGVDIFFLSPMNQESVETALAVTPEFDYRVEWLDEMTLRLRPDWESLKRDMDYVVTIGTEALNLQGTALSDPAQIAFKTVGYLEVSEMIPQPGSGGIPVDTEIVLTFNRPVVPLSVDPGAITTQPLSFEPDIPGKGEWLNTSIYVWQPDEPLPSGQTLQVSVNPDLKDQSGLELDQAYSWEFHTAPPRVIGVEPTERLYRASSRVQYLPLDSGFEISFSQRMDPHSTEDAISLLDDEMNKAVSGSFEWSEDGTAVTFTPYRRLALEKTYTLQVSATALGYESTTPIANPFEENYETMPYPAVRSTSPENGSERGLPIWGIYFNFNTQMDIESLIEEDRVTISPEPPGGYELKPYGVDSASELRIVADLETQTTYTVTLNPGTKDIYGNAIKEPYTFSFTTTNTSSTLQVNMGGTDFYDASLPARIMLTTRNISAVDLKLTRLDSDQIPAIFDWHYVPPAESSEVIRQWQFFPQGDLDRLIISEVSMTPDNSPLPPGIYQLNIGYNYYDSWDNSTEWISDRHFMFVADTHILAKQSLKGALLWVTDLQTGEPIEGAEVELLVGGGSYSKALPAGKETSDADGIVKFNLDDESTYLPDPWVDINGPNSFVMAILDDGKRFGFVYSAWADGIGVWDFDLPGQPDIESDATYVYTDRPIYRPGQTVYFKGIYRTKDDMVYSYLEQERVYVEVCTGYKDTYRELFSGWVDLSPFGTFNGSADIPDDALLDYYTVSVSLQTNEDESHSCYHGISSARFSVEEYRKPEFELSVLPAQEEILSGEQVDITFNGEYYFGEELSNTSLKWGIWAIPYTFDYSGEGYYRFENPDRYWSSAPFHLWMSDYYLDDEYIARDSATLDEDGQLVIDPTLVSPEGSESTWRFVIQGTTNDGSPTEVNAEGQVIVHNSLYYVGTQVEPYTVLEGDEIPVETIVVDWDSQPIPGQTVEVQLVRQTWEREYVVTDSYETTGWHSFVIEEEVGSPVRLVTDEKGLAQTMFLAPDAGSYKVRATIRDNAGNIHRSADFIWVRGEEDVRWRSYEKPDNHIDVVADKESYRAGDVASILITSPYEGEVTALVTVERAGILTHEVFTFSGSSYIYELPITNEHVPNVFFSVVLLPPVREDDPLPDFKMGVTELTVEPFEQTLNVSVTPTENILTPGSEVEFRVEVTDFAGQPVDADVSLALVDKAIFGLARENSSPLLEYYYARQGLGVHTAAPLTALVERQIVALLPPPPCNNCGGGGGDIPPSYRPSGEISVRTEFEDTAFWRAIVQTGEDGVALVSVTLPDNLTTWRMDARAITADTRVGQTTTEVVAKLPVLIRPHTPRFFTQGDKPTLSATVHNNTDEPIDALVMLEAQGLTLSGESAQRITIPADSRVQVSWPGVVGEKIEWVDLTFSVQGTAESGETYADAAKPEIGDPDHDRMLPVLRYDGPNEALIVVGTAGQLSEPGTRTEGILLPSDLDTSRGDIRVQIDPSLASSLIEGLTWLKHYRYECTETTASRILANAATLIALQETETINPALEDRLIQEIQFETQRLENSQKNNGGWGWGPNSQTSSKYLSTYVLHALLVAKQSGQEVDPVVIENAVGYVHSNIEGAISITTEQYLLNRWAYLVYVEELGGGHQGRNIDSLFEIRHNMQLYAQALLAQAIWLNDPDDPRLDTIRSELSDAAIMTATGVHWEETELDYQNWNTNRRTTAIMINTYAQVWPDSDLLAPAVRWLMVAREADHWPTAQETAWSLIGLSHWMAATGDLEADYSWQTLLNGQVVQEGAATPDNLSESQLFTIGLDRLTTGEVNPLIFSRGAGPGQMYYTAHVTAYPEIENLGALSRGVTVTRRYLNEAGEVITEGQSGDTVTVELSIVVPHDLYFVLVEDFYPAGAEPVNPELLTESLLSPPPRLERTDRGWGWWWFSDIQLRDEKVTLSAERLPAGTYLFTYQIRLATEGVYQVIPPQAQELHFPEVYGRGEGMRFTVLPQD